MAEPVEAPPLLKIGQAARAAGVAPTTLRYYERAGLMAATARSGAGYRLYASEDIERLQFIRSAQALGFRLDDIRMLLKLDPGDSRSCRDRVQRVLEERLADIDQKLKELERVRTTLNRALARCRDSTNGCAVLKELGSK